MSKDLASVFPELNDPEWVKDREECWQLALEVGGWKSDYRKKDLDKIRNYFFTGVVDKGLPIVDQWTGMLVMFPIQSHAGYDYYYRQHDLSKDEIVGNIKIALHDMLYLGQRMHEQKAYWDYHMGSQFEKTRTFQTATQRIELEIDEEYFGEQLLAKITLCFPSGRNAQKYCELFDYLISIFASGTISRQSSEKCAEIFSLFVDDMFVVLDGDESKFGNLYKLAQRFHEELERPDSRFPEAVLNLWRERKQDRD